jgi:hypothetical protein
VNESKVRVNGFDSKIKELENKISRMKEKK